MNQEAIKKILPHRDNMLLVEEAEIVDGKAHASIHIRGDEFFLQGHFPGNPVVPGVILCEMMAQGACVLLADGAAEGVTPMFTSMNNVRFKNPVKPGDTFQSVSEITKSKGPFYFCSAKGYVEGKLCCSAEFSFALVK
jgi:3-hydroxyacyl-[acyl-carrier-protein] dehydratase